ncbi:MAG: peptidoglycan editing factor PgeF [Betaproteobacteria bacterium]|jgi:YfiH family protein|nr:peptidoglycan editing factor PgeF [Betaproteobacteria bacterium]
MTLRPIVPDWNVPAAVRALVTTRAGGVSGGAHAALNLGLRCGDEVDAVLENRRRLRALLPAEPLWLRQVHGRNVLFAEQVAAAEHEADASVTTRPHRVCAVLVADCLPVLLADERGEAVGVAHAGWRGLASGVIESTVAAFPCAPTRLVAWLGPAIGPKVYEVGDEVRAAFLVHDAAAASAFVPTRPGHWLADLYALARQRLSACGVRQVGGGGFCTYSETERFFSFRRDRITGRMAALVWLETDRPQGAKVP